MPYSIGLRPEHGYALGTAAASSLVLFYLGMRTAGARRAAKVPYPYAYAEVAEAEKDPLKHVFNCTQRAHQNTLEVYPVFLVLFAISSIEHPLAASAAGSVFWLGRIIYASGYSTGKPELRMRGAFGYFGLIALLGLAIRTVVSVSFSN